MADRSYKLTLSLSDGSTINAGTITAPQGPNGANGATFTPSVSAAGVLSWTNNGGLANPSPISIKGPKGDDAVITASDVENWGFTKNTGTITEIKMNGVSKGKSGVVDLGTVLTAHTGLVGGNLVQYDSSEQTLKDSGKKISDLATTSQVNAMLEDKQDKITSSNKLSSSLIDGLGAAAAKAVDTAISANSTSTNLPTSKAVEDRINAHSGIDKVGTVTTIKINGATKNPASGVVDLGTVITAHQSLDGKQDKITSSNKLSSSLIDGLGAAAAKAVDTAISANSTSTNLPTSKAVEDRINAHSGIDKVGTVTTIKINGATKNPASGVVDLGTVLTDASKFATSAQGTKADNALSLDGGTIKKSKTIKMDASANSDGANLKWGTVNHKNPYIGYASDQVDGTFVVGSLLGTNYASGLAIGGGSGNLLWKGTKVATTNDISGKLDKTTYEVNKTINFGSSGVLYVGKFMVYDTNVTCEVTSTTDVTYSGKLVIATQNYVIKKMTVYGDAANTVTPNFYIKPSTTSDPYIEVYFKPSSWSKNVVHIYGSEIKAEPTNVCTNVPSVPSTATLKPKNALPTYSLSGTTLTITL